MLACQDSFSAGWRADGAPAASHHTGRLAVDASGRTRPSSYDVRFRTKGPLAIEEAQARRWSVVTNRTGSRSRPYTCGGCTAGCKHLINYKRIEYAQCPTVNLTLPRLFDCDHVVADSTPVDVVMYGSSHLRELLYMMYRLLFRQYWPAPLVGHAEADKWATQLGGHGCHSNEACYRQRGRTQFELNVCGKRRLKIYFQFKCFYKEPVGEANFLQELTRRGLRSPDFLFTEASPWTLYMSKEQLSSYRRASRNESQAMKQAEEDYFLAWTARNFANHHTQHVWMLASAESPGSNEPPLPPAQALARQAGLAARTPGWRMCGFNRETLSRPPGGMVCTHGCQGPVLMIHAQMVLRSIGARLRRPAARKRAVNFTAGVRATSQY